VSLTRGHHSDPFPNSVVKLRRGQDTGRVADWDNSSMPGLSLIQRDPSLSRKDPFALFGGAFSITVHTNPQVLNSIVLFI
jgi:hypothetical protein